MEAVHDPGYGGTGCLKISFGGKGGGCFHFALGWKQITMATLFGSETPAVAQMLHCFVSGETN